MGAMVRASVVLRGFVLAALLCGLSATVGLAQALPSVSPSEAGFAPDRLERLHARMQRFVDEGRHAGVVTLIARHGKVVDVQVHGLRDREQRLPMERDTIVRIY
jgi:CubicO group peptidase (beta-lactamase class C family)